MSTRRIHSRPGSPAESPPETKPHRRRAGKGTARARRALLFETLEDRRLLAVSLLKDTGLIDTLVFRDWNGTSDTNVSYSPGGASAPSQVVANGTSTWTYGTTAGDPQIIYNDGSGAWNHANYPWLRVRHQESTTAGGTLQIWENPARGGESANFSPATSLVEVHADVPNPNPNGTGFRIDAFGTAQSGYAFTADYMMLDRAETLGLGEFDRDGDFSSWTPNANIAGASVANGYLSGTGAGTGDAYLTSPTEFSTATYKFVEIRLRGSGSSAEVFWAQGGAFVGGQRIGLGALDGAWHTYLLDFTNESTWTGANMRIRLDPVTAAGATFDVDYIRVRAIPGVLYVNDQWTTPNVAVDGNLETAGIETAYVNYNAFATIDAALAKYPAFAGTIVVNGGSYAAANLSGGGAVQLRLVRDLTGSESDVTFQTLSGDSNDSIVTAYHGTAGNLIVDLSADQTFGGIISGIGRLSKQGTAALTLSGANTYTGGTLVSAGTLKNGVANALPTGTTLTVAGGGATYDLNGFAQQVGGLSDGGVSTGTVTNSGSAATFTVNNAGANTFSGTITSSLALTKQGGGVLTLSQANDYSGGTVISGGTLQMNHAGAVGTGVLTIGNGTTLTLNHSGTTTNAIYLTGATQTIYRNPGTPTLTGDVTTDGSAGALSFGADENSGVNNLTFSGNTIAMGAKTFTITGTTVDGESQAANTKVTLQDVTLTADGNVAVGRGTLQVQGSSSLTLGGQLRASSDWARFVMQDTAVVTAPAGVNFVNNYVATSLWLNGGTLTTPYIYGNNYGGQTHVSFNGTRVVASADAADFLQVRLNGSSDMHSAVAEIANGGAIFDTNGHTVTIANVLTNLSGNTGSLTKLGSGTLTLSRPDTYSGATLVSAGTLKNGAANALPTGTTLTVAGSGATYDLNGFAQQVGGLSDGGVSTGTVTNSGSAATFAVNNAVANTFSGTITGSLALTKTGTGVLTLSGANSYSG
ncbi:MAG TPA: autotransporter-associated beta strand repeat-containing protein, partial [Candidatus Anammoximicrobium sp.]|nr:autotransporter-associated beta strand repeat-containing protein [Candidatus Anammoximicrobium sp.]